MTITVRVEGQPVQTFDNPVAALDYATRHVYLPFKEREPAINTLIYGGKYSYSYGSKSVEIESEMTPIERFRNTPPLYPSREEADKQINAELDRLAAKHKCSRAELYAKAEESARSSEDFEAVFELTARLSVLRAEPTVETVRISEESLKKSLSEAVEIIDTHAPGYTVWLDQARKLLGE